MPKARDYHLTELQLGEIEKAIHHDKRPEVRERSNAIRLLHKGHKPEEVANLQAVSIPTVYSWIKRWLQGGLEGLAKQPKSGRPSKANEAYRQMLEQVLEQEPKSLGYDFAIWTVDRLRQHLEKQTGIALSEPRLRALLKRSGYRYRRPKHDLGHLQDKQAKALAAELLQELKKLSGDDFELIFVDETSLSLDPPLRACWMKVGQQKRVPIRGPGDKPKRHVFGGYNWSKDTITWTKTLTKNTTTFIQFLEELLVKQYPTTRIVLVLDNVGYHKSAQALAALSLFEPWVLPFWLPTYCSDLNPIERFWRYLKDQACANHLEDDIACVLQQAEKIMTHQNNPASNDRFHVSKYL